MKLNILVQLQDYSMSDVHRFTESTLNQHWINMNQHWINTYVRFSRTRRRFITYLLSSKRTHVSSDSRMVPSTYLTRIRRLPNSKLMQTALTFILVICATFNAPTNILYLFLQWLFIMHNNPCSSTIIGISNYPYIPSIANGSIHIQVSARHTSYA